MKKKLYLVFGLLFLVTAGLSGCAKSNPVDNYHSYKYYEKHKKQAKATLDACQKIPASVRQSEKFNLSKAEENCLNAQNVVYHAGDIFNKKLFNAARQHYGR